MEGELRVRRLVVELGASFNGSCKMITEQEYENAAREMAGKEAAGAAACGSTASEEIG